MGTSCGWRSTGGKSLAGFAGVPQRADPAYNSCPLFQSSAHVYSFWHQGQKQTEVCLPRLPNSHNGMHNTIVMQGDDWTHPQRFPLLITNLLILSLCLWSVFKMICPWHPRGQVLNLLQLLRVQHLKRQMLFKSRHPRSPGQPGTHVLFP